MKKTRSEPPEPADDGGPDQAPVDPRPNQLRAAYGAAVRRHRFERTGVDVRYRPSPIWDGGYDPATKRNHRPLWPKLVAAADDVGIDPLVLLRVLFAAWTEDHAPTPHEIVRDANVRRVKARDAVAAQSVTSAAKTESEMFRSALWGASRRLTDPDPRAAVRYVLNDLGNGLSPLFRYTMAVTSGHADLADRWRDLALVQFDRHRDLYLESWRHLLSPDLLAAGAAPEVVGG